MDVICKNCNKTQFLFEENLYQEYCKNCGLIIDEIIIDNSMEWRNFDITNVSRNRVGKSSNLLTKEYLGSTEIFSTNSYSGKVKKLSKWHFKLRKGDSIERNIQLAINKLEKFSEFWNLTDNLKRNVLKYYKQTLEKNLIKGRSIDGILIGCFYFVCKQMGVPITLREIIENLEISKKEIGRNYRFLIKKLNLKKNYVFNFELFLKKIILGLNYQKTKIEEKINDYFELIKKKSSFFSGKSPIGILGTIIYRILQFNSNNFEKDKKKLIKIIKITELTLKNRYEELLQEEKILINNGFKIPL